MPRPASSSASVMIALVVADTCHTLLTRRPGTFSCGNRMHTMPDAFATSIAATRSATSSCSSSSISSGSCVNLATSSFGLIGGVPGGLGQEPNSGPRDLSNSARPSGRAPTPDWATGSTPKVHRRHGQPRSYFHEVRRLPVRDMETGHQFAQCESADPGLGTGQLRRAGAKSVKWPR